MARGAVRAGRVACDRPPDGPGDRPGRDRTHILHYRAGCASSNKQPSFKVVDGRLTSGTRLFDFAGSSGLINGVTTTTDSFTFTVQVKTRPVRPTSRPSRSKSSRPIPTEATSSGTVGEFYCCGNLFASGGVQPYTWSVVAGTLPPGLALPAEEGEHHLRHAHHGWHVHLHRPSHRRSGYLQREGAPHHDHLSLKPPCGSRRHRVAGRALGAGCGDPRRLPGRHPDGMGGSSNPGRSTCTNSGLVQSRSCSVRMTRPCCR